MLAWVTHYSSFALYNVTDPGWYLMAIFRQLPYIVITTPLIMETHRNVFLQNIIEHQGNYNHRRMSLKRILFSKHA